MSKSPLLLLFASALLLVHCATSPASIDAATSAAAPAPAADDEALLATGLKRLRPNGRWTWEGTDKGAQEWVLFAITLTDGRSGSSDVWFVRLSSPSGKAGGASGGKLEEFTLPAPVGQFKRGTKFKAPAQTIQIESYDRAGGFIRQSNRTVPAGSTSGSVEELGRALAGGDPLNSQQPATGAGKADPAADPLVGMIIGMRAVGKSSALKPIRDAARKLVIDEPNVFSLILSGFSLKVRADFSEGMQLEDPWHGHGMLPQYLAASPLFVAGKHVTDATILVGPAEPPFQISAGMLLIEAAHPRRPGNRLTAKVIATSERVLAAGE
jgi:hypothetical protein